MLAIPEITLTGQYVFCKEGGMGQKLLGTSDDDLKCLCTLT